MNYLTKLMIKYELFNSDHVLDGKCCVVLETLVINLFRHTVREEEKGNI